MHTHPLFHIRNGLASIGCTQKRPRKHPNIITIIDQLLEITKKKPENNLHVGQRSISVRVNTIQVNT